MSTNEYLTLSGPGSAQTRVLGSRFLGTASPIVGEDDVTRRLEEEKRRYHDATHWCYAFRLRDGRTSNERASDAGEPHGTAGTPILREIRRRELLDCLVIVTRYFGGTKLGTGGLARAYGECAALALDAAPIVRRRMIVCLHVACTPDDQPIVYRLARRFEAAVHAEVAAAGVAFRVDVPLDGSDALAHALREESRGRIRMSGRDS
jgi:uncharacterized YigZ family protein